MAKKQEEQKKEGKSNDYQIGFHRGALETLIRERSEMARIVSVVEQLMQMHIKAMKELGVDLAEQAKAAKPLESKLK